MPRANLPAETPSGKPMSTPLKPAPDQALCRSESRPQSLAGSRLCKHADYQRAYKASRKRQSASMSWFLAPQQPAYPGAAALTGPRVGLTAGKVLGKSHERNRIKRRVREALGKHFDLLTPGFDLILHPRRIVLTLEFAKLESEIVRILHQAGTEAARMPSDMTTPSGPGAV